MIDDRDRVIAEKCYEEQEKEHDELALAYGEVFNSPAGKIVLKSLKAICNVNSCCVRDAKHPDANAVIFECGKKSVYDYMCIYLRRDYERRKQQ